jgi:hypothetical protein
VLVRAGSATRLRYERLARWVERIVSWMLRTDQLVDRTSYGVLHPAELQYFGEVVGPAILF